MEPKPENLNRITSESQTRTLEQLEKMVEIIDLEIVREGEGINPRKLEELIIRKGRITKQIARLKREPIASNDTDKDTTNLS